MVVKLCMNLLNFLNTLLHLWLIRYGHLSEITTVSKSGMETILRTSPLTFIYWTHGVQSSGSSNSEMFLIFEYTKLMVRNGGPYFCYRGGGEKTNKDAEKRSDSLKVKRDWLLRTNFSLYTSICLLAKEFKWFLLVEKSKIPRGSIPLNLFRR